MREAASRGFWVSSHAPYGYNRIMAQDGAKRRPTLAPDQDASRVVKRIFDLAEAGKGMTDITNTLNSEGISSPKGKLWGKTSVHGILTKEAYTGTLDLGGNLVAVGTEWTGRLTAIVDEMDEIEAFRNYPTSPIEAAMRFRLSSLVECWEGQCLILS